MNEYAASFQRARNNVYPSFASISSHDNVLKVSGGWRTGDTGHVREVHGWMRIEREARFRGGQRNYLYSVVLSRRLLGARKLALHRGGRGQAELKVSRLFDWIGRSRLGVVLWLLVPTKAKFDVASFFSRGEIKMGERWKVRIGSNYRHVLESSRRSSVLPLWAK